MFWSLALFLVVVASLFYLAQSNPSTEVDWPLCVLIDAGC
jgi:hypothetical protein